VEFQGDSVTFAAQRKDVKETSVPDCKI